MLFSFARCSVDFYSDEVGAICKASISELEFDYNAPSQGYQISSTDYPINYSANMRMTGMQCCLNSQLDVTGLVVKYKQIQIVSSDVDNYLGGLSGQVEQCFGQECQIGCQPMVEWHPLEPDLSNPVAYIEFIANPGLNSVYVYTLNRQKFEICGSSYAGSTSSKIALNYPFLQFGIESDPETQAIKKITTFVNKCPMHKYGAQNLIKRKKPYTIQLSDNYHIQDNNIQFPLTIPLPTEVEWLSSIDYPSTTDNMNKQCSYSLVSFFGAEEPEYLEIDGNQINVIGTEQSWPAQPLHDVVTIKCDIIFEGYQLTVKTPFEVIFYDFDYSKEELLSDEEKCIHQASLLPSGNLFTPASFTEKVARQGYHYIDSTYFFQCCKTEDGYISDIYAKRDAQSMEDFSNGSNIFCNQVQFRQDEIQLWYLQTETETESIFTYQDFLVKLKDHEIGMATSVCTLENIDIEQRKQAITSGQIIEIDFQVHGYLINFYYQNNNGMLQNMHVYLNRCKFTPEFLDFQSMQASSITIADFTETQTDIDIETSLNWNHESLYLDNYLGSKPEYDYQTALQLQTYLGFQPVATTSSYHTNVWPLPYQSIYDPKGIVPLVEFKPPSDKPRLRIQAFSNDYLLPQATDRYNVYFEFGYKSDLTTFVFRRLFYSIRVFSISNGLPYIDCIPDEAGYSDGPINRDLSDFYIEHDIAYFTPIDVSCQILNMETITAVQIFAIDAFQSEEVSLPYEETAFVFQLQGQGQYHTHRVTLEQRTQVFDVTGLTESQKQDLNWLIQNDRSVYEYLQERASFDVFSYCLAMTFHPDEFTPQTIRYLYGFEYQEFYLPEFLDSDSYVASELCPIDAVTITPEDFDFEFQIDYQSNLLSVNYYGTDLQINRIFYVEYSFGQGISSVKSNPFALNVIFIPTKCMIETNLSQKFVLYIEDIELSQNTQTLKFEPFLVSCMPELYTYIAFTKFILYQNGLDVTQTILPEILNSTYSGLDLQKISISFAQNYDKYIGNTFELVQLTTVYDSRNVNQFENDPVALEDLYVNVLKKMPDFTFTNELAEITLESRCSQIKVIKTLISDITLKIGENLTLVLPKIVDEDGFLARGQCGKVYYQTQQKDGRITLPRQTVQVNALDLTIETSPNFVAGKYEFALQYYLDVGETDRVFLDSNNFKIFLTNQDVSGGVIVTQQISVDEFVNSPPFFQGFEDVTQLSLDRWVALIGQNDQYQLPKVSDVDSDFVSIDMQLGSTQLQDCMCFEFDKHNNIIKVKNLPKDFENTPNQIYIILRDKYYEVIYLLEFRGTTDISEVSNRKSDVRPVAPPLELSDIISLFQKKNFNKVKLDSFYDDTFCIPASTVMDNQGSIELTFNKEVVFNYTSNPNLDQMIQDLNLIQVQLVDLIDDQFYIDSYNPASFEQIQQLRKFNWTISQKSDRTLNININFSHPEVISTISNQKDLLRIILADTQSFIKCSSQIDLEENRRQLTSVTQYLDYQRQLSENTDFNMIPLDYQIFIEVPIQLLPEEQATAISVAEIQEVSTQTLFYTSMVIAAISNISLQMIWGSINALQIISHIPMNNISLPAQSILLFQFLGRVVSFDIFAPTDYFDFGFTPTEPFNEAYNDLGYESIQFIENLGSIGLLIVIVSLRYLLQPLLFFFSSMCACCKCWRNYRQRVKLTGSKASNGSIRFGLETYFELIISCLLGFGVKEVIEREDMTIADKISFTFNYFFMLLVVIFPIIVIVFTAVISRSKIFNTKEEIYQQNVKVVQQLLAEPRHSSIVEYGPHVFFKDQQALQNELPEIESNSSQLTPSSNSHSQSSQTSQFSISPFRLAVNSPQKSDGSNTQRNLDSSRSLLPAKIQPKSKDKPSPESKSSSLRPVTLPRQIQKPSKIMTQFNKKNAFSKLISPQKTQKSQNRIGIVKYTLSSNKLLKQKSIQQKKQAKKELFKRQQTQISATMLPRRKAVHSYSIKSQQVSHSEKRNPNAETTSKNVAASPSRLQASSSKYGWYPYVEVLYEDLRENSVLAMQYYPLYLIRRIVFVLTAIYLQERPYLQVLSFIATAMFFMSYLANGRPFVSKSQTYFELFNEMCVLLTGYHLVLLAGFDMTIVGRANVGTSMFIVIAFMIAVNNISWIINLFQHFKMLYFKCKNKSLMDAKCKKSVEKYIASSRISKKNQIDLKKYMEKRLEKAEQARQQIELRKKQDQDELLRLEEVRIEIDSSYNSPALNMHLSPQKSTKCQNMRLWNGVSPTQVKFCDSRSNTLKNTHSKPIQLQLLDKDAKELQILPEVSENTSSSSSSGYKQLKEMLDLSNMKEDYYLNSSLRKMPSIISLNRSVLNDSKMNQIVSPSTPREQTDSSQISAVKSPVTPPSLTEIARSGYSQTAKAEQGGQDLEYNELRNTSDINLTLMQIVPNNLNSDDQQLEIFREEQGMLPPQKPVFDRITRNRQVQLSIQEILRPVAMPILAQKTQLVVPKRVKTFSSSQKKNRLEGDDADIDSYFGLNSLRSAFRQQSQNLELPLFKTPHKLNFYQSPEQKDKISSSPSFCLDDLLANRNNKKIIRVGKRALQESENCEVSSQTDEILPISQVQNNLVQSPDQSAILLQAANKQKKRRAILADSPARISKKAKFSAPSTPPESSIAIFQSNLTMQNRNQHSQRSHKSSVSCICDDSLTLHLSQRKDSLVGDYPVLSANRQARS